MTDLLKRAILLKERFIYKYISLDFLNKKISPTKTKYKICVLLSGGLRNFEYTTDWINKFLIDPLNADVFVYGWANINGVEDNVKKINKINNIRSFRINDIEDPDFNHIKHNNHLIERFYGQFYNIQQCNELRKEYETSNNIEYDIIIRARPDVFFFSEIEDSDIEYIYENNSVGIPVEYFKIWSTKTTDVFAMGNRYVMDKYCQAFDTVLESNYIIGESESVVDYHIKNKMNVEIYDMLPNFIIDYPCDLSTESMQISPKIGDLSESVTNRLLFQNDIININDIQELKKKYYIENGKINFKR